MVAGARFVGIGAQDERAPAEDFAEDKIDVHVTAVFTAFEAEAVRRQAIVVSEVYVQRARKEAQAGFAFVVIAELRDPLREVALAAADSAEEFHALGKWTSPIATDFRLSREEPAVHVGPAN